MVAPGDVFASFWGFPFVCFVLSCRDDECTAVRVGMNVGSDGAVRTVGCYSVRWLETLDRLK